MSRSGDPMLQSHFWIQGDLEKPKQLLQMAFYWLERHERHLGDTPKKRLNPRKRLNDHFFPTMLNVITHPEDLKGNVSIENNQRNNQIKEFKDNLKTKLKDFKQYWVILPMVAV